MPSTVCVSCGQHQRIPPAKWKLILDDEPYVCSAKCVLSWILEHKSEVSMKSMLDPTSGFVIDTQTSSERKVFRSDFEKRFGAWLNANGIPFYYERWLFHVGSTVYIPDFHIPNGFIETKGLWRLGQKKKFKKFRDEYPQVPILVVPWIIQGEFK